MGSKPLIYAQFGRETTWNTGVAATAKLMGLDDLKTTVDIANTQARYLQGDYAPAHAVTQTYASGQIKTAGVFNFDDACVICDAALQGGVAGSLSDTSAYTWTYAAPYAAAGGQRPRTLEVYDGQQGYKLTGGLIKGFGLQGQVGGGNLVRMTTHWLGGTFAKATPTAAISARTVRTHPASLVSLRADNFGGTVGTTVLASTLIDWSLDYDSGLHLKQFGHDTSLAPTSYGYGTPTATLRAKLEFNANAVAELDKFIAGAGRLIELRGTSPELAGAATVYKQFKIQFAGDITSVSDLWSDRDGNTVIDVTLSARVDTGTFANYLKVILVNSMSALPG